MLMQWRRRNNGVLTGIAEMDGQLADSVEITVSRPSWAWLREGCVWDFVGSRDMFIGCHLPPDIPQLLFAPAFDTCPHVS